MSDTTEAMRAALLPCPFCGNQPKSKNYGCDTPGMEDCGYWGIDCCNAFAHSEESEADAAAAWNRRAPAAPAVTDSTHTGVVPLKFKSWYADTEVCSAEDDRLLAVIQAGPEQARIVSALRALAARPSPEAATAETAGKAPASVPSYLQPDDLAALQRFNETAADDGSYDLNDGQMLRLADLGVVNKLGRRRFAVTAFGRLCLGEDHSQLPLETVEECNARLGAEHAFIGENNEST